MAEHLPNHYPFEEVKFISPFVLPKLACEIERTPSPSLEPKSCPSGHPNIVLDSGRDSTLILHKKIYAMDNPSAPTLETKKKDSTVEHESFSFETPHVSCSFLESLEFISLKTTCSYKDANLLLILVHKLYRRMVVDAFIYHKYFKSRSCTMAHGQAYDHKQSTARRYPGLS